MPKEFLEAANWWVDHQEQPTESDTPVKRTDKNGDVTGWDTPYIDRLSFNLHRFITLPHIQQVYVVEKIEDGIPWRGDGMMMYKEIVIEAEKMALDKDKYIDNAFRVLEGLR